MTLVPEGISEIDASGITGESGHREEFDVIVLATGFDVTDFLGPLKIIGKDGIDLHQQWKDHVGAQAYLGMHVHNFPNFAMMWDNTLNPRIAFSNNYQVRTKHISCS